MLERSENASVLITGATGLIGSNLVLYLHKNAPSCQIIGIVRNVEKAKRIFGADCGSWLKLVCADVTEPIAVDGTVDYIIHGASVTASRDFVENPVDTIVTAVRGTENMLKLAVVKRVKSFVYLSSMEVYGSPQTSEKIDENYPSNLDTMAVRSSYPESKRLCEALCTAYSTQYGVPAKIVRLAQTIGQGIDYNDGRVFAEFARCVIEKRNIVLHTKGETRRCYLSIEDAASAILTVLLKGENGQAYNAANEATYCSIYEMAELVARECANGEIGVEIRMEDTSKYGYAPVLRMNLNTEKLRALGWKTDVGLAQMYHGLIDDMKLGNINEVQK